MVDSRAAHTEASTEDVDEEWPQGHLIQDLLGVEEFWRDLALQVIHVVNQGFVSSGRISLHLAREFISHLSD